LTLFSSSDIGPDVFGGSLHRLGGEVESSQQVMPHNEWEQRKFLLCFAECGKVLQASSAQRSFAGRTQKSDRMASPLGARLLKRSREEEDGPAARFRPTRGWPASLPHFRPVAPYAAAPFPNGPAASLCFVLYQDFLTGVEIAMRDETKRELVRSGERSELLAPGSTDAPTLSAQQIMALLRESLAKRAQRSDSEIQAGLTSLRRLADHGNIDAQKNLGFLYYCGRDVPQDYAQAAQWYRKAADQGDYLAQFELGEMYRQGQGVPQDYAQAVDWLRKSAEQGFDEAAWSLVEMYSLGQGVPQDHGEAAT
jgi:hypothetical protein